MLTKDHRRLNVMGAKGSLVSGSRGLASCCYPFPVSVILLCVKRDGAKSEPQSQHHKTEDGAFANEVCTQIIELVCNLRFNNLSQYRGKTRKDRIA